MNRVAKLIALINLQLTVHFISHQELISSYIATPENQNFADAEERICAKRTQPCDAHASMMRGHPRMQATTCEPTNEIPEPWSPR
ncbi:hypothetical protein PVAG01_07504 [Phlyctema vagabunda]|uniref:Secreted protein n=1 Tax=Phlyctema vagabunda TaxID=108571 RepID=A0ABR4PCL1_9HELO